MNKQIQNSPIVKLGCVANIFTRQMHFKDVGDIEHGHTHPFDHTTLLAYGSLKVRVNGEETIFNAPCMIFIKAETAHELEALEANTVAVCIHALRGGESFEDIIDPNSTPNGVRIVRGCNLSPSKTPEWHQNPSTGGMDCHT